MSEAPKVQKVLAVYLEPQEDGSSTMRFKDPEVFAALVRQIMGAIPQHTQPLQPPHPAVGVQPPPNRPPNQPVAPIPAAAPPVKK